jgi:hypothetical protein
MPLHLRHNRGGCPPISVLQERIGWLLSGPPDVFQPVMKLRELSDRITEMFNDVV